MLIQKQYSKLIFTGNVDQDDGGGSTEVTLKYWSNSSNGSTEGTNGTEVTLNLSSNVVGNSNDETNFHKLLLTNAQVLKLRKAFVNGSSANIKFSKTQLSKMI